MCTPLDIDMFYEQNFDIVLIVSHNYKLCNHEYFAFIKLAKKNYKKILIYLLMLLIKINLTFSYGLENCLNRQNLGLSNGHAQNLSVE